MQPGIEHLDYVKFMPYHMQSGIGNFDRTKFMSCQNLRGGFPQNFGVGSRG